MHKNLKTTLAVAALAASFLASSPLYAHESGRSQGSIMGPGMMGQGGSMNMMSRGMMGQGTMMGPTMMRQGGMLNMMGSGMTDQHMMGHDMKGHGVGGRVVPIQHLSVDDVRHFFEHRLEQGGNKRLKVGEVKEQDDGVFIIADIVTVDDSLVERLKVDRHDGGIERVE